MNVSDDDVVSYLVFGHFPSPGNRTSSRGSSPADGGRPLLPHPDAPTSTVTLLQKHEKRFGVKVHRKSPKLLWFNRRLEKVKVEEAEQQVNIHLNLVKKKKYSPDILLLKCSRASPARVSIKISYNVNKRSTLTLVQLYINSLKYSVCV